MGCYFLANIRIADASVYRMFVRKDYRGKGFSRMILGELESWAAERGATELVLETGVNS